MIGVTSVILISAAYPFQELYQEASRTAVDGNVDGTTQAAVCRLVAASMLPQDEALLAVQAIQGQYQSATVGHLVDIIRSSFCAPSSEGFGTTLDAGAGAVVTFLRIAYENICGGQHRPSFWQFAGEFQSESP